MIEKNERFYIKEWFDVAQEYNDGDILDFKMPSFYGGEYSAKIYIDSDGDPYIEKSKNYYEGCRNYEIRQKL